MEKVNQMKRFLEICCDSVQSAIYAEKGGADRIELCESLAHGGLSPSPGKILLCKKYISIPVFVLIRPRKADFCYSALEIECMIENIQQAKQLGADGIVSGCLKTDGTIDVKNTQALIEATRPLPFTFHRAFDRCPNPFDALEQLLHLGVDRILTSGQENTALEGLRLLKELDEKASGQITLLIGGKVRPESIGELVTHSDFIEFHSSAKKTVKSKVQLIGQAKMGDETLEAEYSWHEVDTLMVKEMKAIIDRSK